MFSSNNSPFTMPVTPANSGGFGFGGNGFDSIIALAIIGLIFGGFNGGWGFGSGGGQLGNNYALISDNATLERKIDGVYSGICDSTFALNNTITNGFASAQNTMTQGFAGLNTALVTQGYESRIATQGVGNTVQNCCCDLRQQIGDVNYNIATQANGLTNTISNGFCQTNFNNQTNTRDIIDTQRADTQAILAKLDSMETNRLREKLEAERDAKYALQGQLDRAKLRTDIVNDVRPCPIPAYPACNPWGCNCQQNVYGTTIA